MSKLWMSGEIQVDVNESFGKASNAIEGVVNHLIEDVSFGGKIEQWAFIAIIRKEDHPLFDEVVKKSSRGKVLEFRLKIPHTEFLSASPKEQTRLILKGLLRSVTLMDRIGLSAEIQDALRTTLSRAEFELVGPDIPSQKN
jgi:hypothetical protein